MAGPTSLPDATNCNESAGDTPEDSDEYQSDGYNDVDMLDNDVARLQHLLPSGADTAEWQATI